MHSTQALQKGLQGFLGFLGRRDIIYSGKRRLEACLPVWTHQAVHQGNQLAGIQGNQGYGRIPPKCTLTKFYMGNGAKGIPPISPLLPYPRLLICPSLFLDHRLQGSVFLFRAWCCSMISKCPWSFPNWRTNSGGAFPIWLETEGFKHQTTNTNHQSKPPIQTTNPNHQSKPPTNYQVSPSGWLGFVVST